MSAKVRITILIVPLCLIAAVVGCYLSVAYVPSWYRPQYVGPGDQQDIRDEFTAISCMFNNNMQRLEPFTLTLSERQVNRIISGRRWILDDLADAIPNTINDMAFAWRDGCVKIGARIDFKGTRVLASVIASISADDKALHLNTLKVRIGTWPVPQNLVRRYVTEYAAGARNEAGDLLIKLLEEGHITNRFPYFHSDYDLQIETVSCRDGELIVRVIPVNNT